MYPIPETPDSMCKHLRSLCHYTTMQVLIYMFTSCSVFLEKQRSLTSLHWSGLVWSQNLRHVTKSTMPMPTLATAAVIAATSASPPLSTLDSLLDQVKQAAKDGNMKLVEDRCQRIHEICSFGAVQPLQARSRTAASASLALETCDQKAKPGGLEYRPEFMLQVVLLADTLIQGCNCRIFLEQPNHCCLLSHGRQL